MNRSLIGRVLTGRDRLPEVRYLGHESGPVSHLINPVFDQTRCRCVVAFFAYLWLFLCREWTAIHQSRQRIDNEVVLDDDPFLLALHDYENAPLHGRVSIVLWYRSANVSTTDTQVSTDPIV